MPESVEHGDGELQAVEIPIEEAMLSGTAVQLAGDVIQETDPPVVGKVLHEGVNQGDGVVLLFACCSHVGPE